MSMDICDYAPPQYRKFCNLAKQGGPYIWSAGKHIYNSFLKNVKPKSYWYRQNRVPKSNMASVNNYVNPNVGGMRRSRYRKRSRKGKVPLRKMRGLNRKQKRLVYKMIEEPTKTNQYRNMSTGQIACPANSCLHWQTSVLYENTVQDILRRCVTLEPAGGALPYAASQNDMDLSTGTQTTVLFNYYGSLFVFRNNCSMGGDIEFTWFKCIDDTTEEPLVGLQNALTAKGSAYTINDPMINIRYDGNCSSGWKRQWKIYKRKQVRLIPGGEYSAYIGRKKPFKWGVNINTGAEYHKKKSLVLVARLIGTVAHDQTTTNVVGTAPFTLDYIRYIRVGFATADDDSWRYTRLLADQVMPEMTEPVVRQPDNEENKYDI